jgi:hypothetical protein
MSRRFTPSKPAESNRDVAAIPTRGTRMPALVQSRSGVEARPTAAAERPWSSPGRAAEEARQPPAMPNYLRAGRSPTVRSWKDSAHSNNIAKPPSLIAPKWMEPEPGACRQNEVVRYRFLEAVQKKRTQKFSPDRMQGIFATVFSPDLSKLASDLYQVTQNLRFRFEYLGARRTSICLTDLVRQAAVDALFRPVSGRSPSTCRRRTGIF